jgi:hypothetical protein
VRPLIVPSHFSVKNKCDSRICPFSSAVKPLYSTGAKVPLMCICFISARVACSAFLPRNLNPDVCTTRKIRKMVQILYYEHSIHGGENNFHFHRPFFHGRPLVVVCLSYGVAVPLLLTCCPEPAFQYTSYASWRGVEYMIIGSYNNGS